MKTLIKSLLIVFLFIGLFSCDNNDDKDLEISQLRLTRFNDFNFSYDNMGYISKITHNKGEWTFIYNGNILTQVNYIEKNNPHKNQESVIYFEYEGNKIIVNNWLEPDVYLVRQEIELDQDQHITRITDLGIFDDKVALDGRTYTTFKYEKSPKRLSESETWQMKNSRIVNSAHYEYEKSNGMMGTAVAPNPWFFTYWGFSQYSLRVPFLSTINNLSSLTFVWPSEGKEIIQYNYNYNKEKFPILLKSSEEKEKITIEYELFSKI